MVGSAEIPVVVARKSDKENRKIDRGESVKKTWVVTRHIVERMLVEADTKKEAQLNAANPYEVIVTRETCVEEKDENRRG